jgi:hypothetical protein
MCEFYVPNAFFTVITSIERRSMHKKIFLGLCSAGVIAVGLVACGAGSGAGSNSGTATTINGIAVPPAPDAAANNATLAGVDSNGNGVRDDVERKIAESYPKNYDELISVATTFQKIIVGQPVSDTEDKTTFCILASSEVSSEDFSELLLNNNDRYGAYSENVGLRKIWECK